jgi:hypothetical protein
MHLLLLSSMRVSHRPSRHCAWPMDKPGELEDSLHFTWTSSPELVGTMS